MFCYILEVVTVMEYKLQMLIIHTVMETTLFLLVENVGKKFLQHANIQTKYTNT